MVGTVGTVSYTHLPEDFLIPLVKTFIMLTDGICTAVTVQITSISHGCLLYTSLAKGQPFEIISDIGSGINYKKKELQELIRRISQNQVEKVVVLYKDRLLRFGFELIEYIASLYNCEIEIIDNTEKSEQQELVEDLVQMITVFSR